MLSRWEIINGKWMMTNGPNDGMTEHYTISLYAPPVTLGKGNKNTSASF